MSSAGGSPVSPAGRDALVIHRREGVVWREDSPMHLAIGMFDGVHLGHQAVIRQAVHAARGKGHVSGVLTFDPHPSHVLYPERATAMLMPLEQRVHHMLLLGVDFVFVQPFTMDYARRKAGDFVVTLKRSFPSLATLHVGDNFRYGAGRSGDITTLSETASREGVQLHALPREHVDGETISSSRIRTALAQGDVSLAQAMLGAPYLVEGRVTKGKGIGRQMDYPTLNVPWNPQAQPRFGVYRVCLRKEGSDEAFMGIANYGVRPTFGEAAGPLLEIHLLDPGEYPTEADDVRVALLGFIRPEQAFPSPEALRSQIQKDVELVARQLSSGENAAPPVF